VEKILMKQMQKHRVNILVCITILIGFIAVGSISYCTYSKIIKDDIINISKLTTTNIYSDISSELTKPIFVALTMANDSFVKNWMVEEAEGNQDIEHQQKLTEYLNGIKVKYNYNSVFLLSEYSKNYYHFKGINKVINKNKLHDNWYFNFLNTNLPYGLDIDTDEVNQDKLSVFVNCRIENENKKLMGVTGVGLELNKVQKLMRGFEKEFQLETMLFNKNGVVQVHTDSNRIGKENVFDNIVLAENKDKILNNKDSVAVYKYKNKESNGYLIVRYIDEMDWYLLVRKDTSILVKSFQILLLKDFIIYILVIIGVSFLITKLIKRNDEAIIKMANTDSLTGLSNRRGFNETIESIITDQRNNKAYHMFVFDIDNLKIINDRHGHLIGDKVIMDIGKIVSDGLNCNGMVSRWGGDEFAGFIFGDREIAENLIHNIFELIHIYSENQTYHSTISMGITLVKDSDSIDSLIKRSDTALYYAKDRGKNRFKFL
jgi:diguanylate cyclase (GGDEF)-like protein